MQHISHCYKNFANFNGRATRSEFWLFYLFGQVVGLLLMIIGFAAAFMLGYMGAIHDNPNVIPLIFACFIPMFIFGLVNIIPSLAVGARRLHDAGFSGWLLLLFLVPLGGFAIFIMWLLESQQGDNQYGPDPFGRPPLPKY